MKSSAALDENNNGIGIIGFSEPVSVDYSLHKKILITGAHEAPEEEQNFASLLEFINASETREDDENFKNAVDEIFEELAEREPEHFAVRQYAKFKLAAGKTSKSILISCGARKVPH